MDLVHSNVWHEDLHQVEGYTLMLGGALAEVICGKFGRGGCGVRVFL